MLNRSSSAREQELCLSDAVRELEPALKSALYASYELAGATKAALYLATSYTADDYEIVTSYAFNAADRAKVDSKDPLVHRLSLAHSPILMNAMSEDTMLADVLFRHDHQRLIAVPIFGRGRRMVGFLDLRDKAGRKPFVAADVAAAERIMREIVRILASRNLFGVGRIPLVEMTRKGRRNSGAFAAPDIPIAKADRSGATLSTQAIEVIRLAHDRMTQRNLSIDSRRRIVTEEEFDRIRLLLPAALAIPGVVAAALTSWNHDERQAIVAYGEPTPTAVTLIRQQIAKWGGRRVSDGATVFVSNPSRIGTHLSHEQLRTVATCPLA